MPLIFQFPQKYYEPTGIYKFKNLQSILFQVNFINNKNLIYSRTYLRIWFILRTYSRKWSTYFIYSFVHFIKTRNNCVRPHAKLLGDLEEKQRMNVGIGNWSYSPKSCPRKILYSVFMRVHENPCLLLTKNYSLFLKVL